MKTISTAIAVAAVAVFGATQAYAQSIARPVPIVALMSPQELNATGIRALTPAQVDALSQWLANYRMAAEILAVEAAFSEEDPVGGQATAIESNIDGDFDGWVGDTVFRLENGQIWQQASPSARYLFAHSPKVWISPAPHRLRVEGMPVEIAVRRLR